MGVKLETKVISGKDYTAWVAGWNDLDGTCRTKNFSTNKYGYDLAKQLAIDCRNSNILRLNEEGAGYAQSQGVKNKGRKKMSEQTILGPTSEAHRKFLNCKSSFVIFGGGAGF